MSKQPHEQRIVFFGTADFSVPSLGGLIESGFNVVAVVTKPDSRSGRSKLLLPPAAKTLAEQSNIPVFQPEKLIAITSTLRNLKPDAGVVVSYGKIIPTEIIELFPLGLINIHPSLLPKYRGPSPIEAAVLNGDEETGITLMQISEEMDAGPIFLQERFPLSGTETQNDLYEQLSTHGAKLLIQNLPGIFNGTLTVEPQDDAQATYTKIISKNDGEIDWKKPADQIEREIRAYLSWPGSHTKIHDRDIIITKAHVVPKESLERVTEGVFNAQPTDMKPGFSIETKSGFLGAVCGKDALRIDRLKPAGKKEMTSGEFIRGLR